MKLADLINSLPPSRRPVASIPAIEIGGIQEDSRRVRPGDLFVARGGTKTDGARFLADAQAKGAVAAIVAKAEPACSLPQVIHRDPASLISLLASAFYGDPARHLKLIGITGTNGKTTTTYLLRHALNKSGIRCGMIGTVEIDDGAACIASEMTTPSPIDVAELMARMRRNGCAACAMEVSSHALHQGRVDAMQFAAAAFTNLTGDHMDYHKTRANYARAKARLFELLPAGAAAIVNARGRAWKRMVRKCQGRILRFGVDMEAEYRASEVEVTSQGTSFLLDTPTGRARVKMKLVGLHNVENALTAAGCLGEVFGFTAEQIAGTMADTTGAPGRLQPVTCGQPFAVLVDYAHTDDALSNVLKALRPLTTGKLRVLFGCGGDRDAIKRPRMARMARRLADAVYITSDNPRTEDPAKIIADITAGLSQRSRKPTYVEPDRRTAIRKIIGDAAAGDVVLLAGKGHENYQIIGTTKHHFDDIEEATRALS